MANWEVKELLMMIDNYEGFYNRKMMMWKNLYRKTKRGIFDPVKAEKLFDYLTTSVSRYYKDEYGGGFDKATRQQANKELVKEFLEEMSYRKEEIGGIVPQTPQIVRASSGKWYNPKKGQKKCPICGRFCDYQWQAGGWYCPTHKFFFPSDIANSRRPRNSYRFYGARELNPVSKKATPWIWLGLLGLGGWWLWKKSKEG